MTFRAPADTSTLLFAATGRVVVAADAATGQVVWRHAVGSSRDTDRARIGLLRDHLVVARGFDLHCLDQRSGKVVWKKECPISATSLVVSVSGRILAASGGEVACFDESGKLLWHELLGGEGPVSLAIEGVVLQADVVGSE